MYHDYFLGDKGVLCAGLTTLPLHVPTVSNFGSLELLKPSGPVQGLLGLTGIEEPVQGSGRFLYTDKVLY